MFTELDPRTSAVDQSERAIRAAILDGRLAPGDRLPPERRLAETFGINRLTLRAALARLAAAGLVSVRQGSGYLVRDWRDGGPDLLAGLVAVAGDGKAARAMCADLLAVRRQLARAVLERLAAEPARPAVTARFTAAVDAMDELVRAGAGPERLAAADLAILGVLLDASGSQVFRLCANPVAQVLASLPPLRAAIFADPASNVAGWRAFAAWLERRPRAAVDGMLALLAAHDTATIERLASPRAPARRGRP